MKAKRGAPCPWQRVAFSIGWSANMPITVAWRTVTCHGLFCHGTINSQSSWGRDALAAISDGNVDGLSIGYREVKATPDGVFRNLEELDLLEISPVTFPANPLARLTSKAELADLLTKAGLSRAAAARVAAGGFPALAGSDDTDDTDDTDEIDALIRAVKLSTDRLKEA